MASETSFGNAAEVSPVNQRLSYGLRGLADITPSSDLQTNSNKGRQQKAAARAATAKPTVRTGWERFFLTRYSRIMGNEDKREKTGKTTKREPKKDGAGRKTGKKKK